MTTDSAPERIFKWALGSDGHVFYEPPRDIDPPAGVRQIPYIRQDISDAAVEVARAEERERCAKICEQWFGTPDADDIARILHAAIRETGDE